MIFKRKIKLLNKTSAFYLIFTFVVFSVSALFLANMANHYIDSYVEKRFTKYERRVKKHLKRESKPHHLPAFLKLRPVTEEFASSFTPHIKDTTIYNESIDENMRYRKKRSIIKSGNRFYLLESIVRVEDFYQLRDDLLAGLVPLFIVLAIGLILFNYYLSGYFFKPFNQILHQMKIYKVGRSSVVRAVKTNTEEFIRMQELFQKMIAQIENDYRNLKEYTENMAHEIQTPLAVMRTKLETLMSDETVMQKHSNSVRTLYNEVNHLSRLGNALNLLTRIENGEFSNRKVILTKQAIQEHLQSIEELAALKQITIHSELSAEHRVTMDPYLFDIVLKNLVRNALQHAVPDSEITLKTTSTTFTICNSGPPLDFPPDQLFRRFVKRKDNRESLGLGLALVKKICDLNGLKISYQYTNGRHCFYLQNV